MLENLIIYRELLEDEIIQLSMDRKNVAFPQNFYHALVHTGQEQGLVGDIWQQYIFHLLLSSDNLLSRAAASGLQHNLTEELLAHAVTEINNIKRFASSISLMTEIDIKWLKEFPLLSTNACYSTQYINHRNALYEQFWHDSAQESLELLLDFYSVWGYGDIAHYTSFVWRNRLVGIADADLVAKDNLIGYQWQKDTVFSNTAAFLQGCKANNLLLYGENGTGKSSMIKAVANEYAQQGLKLVEMPVSNLKQLPDLLQAISCYHQQKFIIFFDDLSFDQGDREYKYLKSIIEGGLAGLPANVILYATSNRRHLIAESWLDHQNNDDMRGNDTVSEKMSLSDRFGVTIFFPSPNQEEFLEIVRGLAQQEQLQIEATALQQQALQWEKWHNGRSGRSARQFINSLLSQVK